MNKLFLALTFLMLTMIGYSQSTKKTITERDTETEIRALEQNVVKAILNGDTNTLKQLWAPEFLVNNPRNEISVNRNEVLRLQKAGMIDYSSFEKAIEQIQVQKSFVITMGQETIVSKNDIPGVKAGVPFKRRFTNIWMKKNGKWQQIGRHASVVCS